jgi:hypothetical protein
MIFKYHLEGERLQEGKGVYLVTRKNPVSGIG